MLLECVSLLFRTILLRPYVFGFLALYLIIGSMQLGWPRILVWTVSSYVLALAAEYGSVRWGIPFGDYSYIPATQGRELWVAGVPFMDTISFSFLSYTGFSCAWHIVAATKIGPFKADAPADRPEYFGVRRSLTVLIVGVVTTVLMDVIVDPVALMGDRWFLGKIYCYEHHGLFFGVPVSNFLGWGVTSAAIIGLNQFLDARLPQGGFWSPRLQMVPHLHLGGFALFFLVSTFNLAVALWLNAWKPFLVGSCLAVVFLTGGLRIVIKGRLLP